MGQKTVKAIETAERERKAVVAALSGASFDDIARDLGYTTRAGAWKAVQRALKRTVQPAADEYRQLELMRLDRLLVGLWPIAIGDGDTPPDYEAIDRVIRIMQRRAKLLGLDAPVKIDVGALVRAAAKRHGLSADESRVMFDRIETFLAEQRAGLS
jgi:hypothetical protein